MKKALLKAACAILAFAGICPSASAALNIEENKAYAVKHVASGLYLDIVNLKDEHGTVDCPVVASSPIPIYFTQVPDNDAKFYIHTNPEDDTIQYLTSGTVSSGGISNSWRASVKTASEFDETFYWTVAEVEDDSTTDQVITLTGTAANKGLGPVGYSDGEKCYANKPDSGNELDQWVLIDYKEPRHVTITIPAIGGGTETIENDIMDGDDILPIMMSYNPLLFVDGVQQSSSVVGKNNTSFSINGKWLVNHAMRLKLRPDDEDRTYIKYTDSKLVCNDMTDASALQPERLWYFKYVNTDDNGHIHVTIHSFALPEVFGVTASGNNVSMTTNPTEFFITNNDSYQQLSTPHSFTIEKSGQETFLSNMGNASEVVMYANNMSPRDYNSLIQIFDMEDADFTATSWNNDGETIDFDTALLESAKNSDGAVADMRALFGETVFAASAKGLYAGYTGVSVEHGGNISVPGYASASNQVLVDLYEAIKNSENISEKMLAASEANPGFAYETTDGAIYAIKNVNTDTRGYLCHNNGNMTNSVAGGLNPDTTYPDFQFTFVTVNGKKYLYNLAAEGFMNAFGEKTDNGDSNVRACADFTWQFDAVPTAFNLTAFQSAYPHSFTIQAGKILNTETPEGFSFTGTHEGGLSMTDNGTRPNVVSMGITNRGDGNGLYAEFIGVLTDDEVEAIKTKATEGLNSVAARIPEDVTADNHIVNHFTHEAITDINGTTGEDHQQYKLATAARQNVVVGQNYILKSETGSDAWMVKLAENKNEAPTASFEEFDADNLAHYTWTVTKAETPALYYDGEDATATDASKYVFTNTYTAPNGTEHTVNITVNGETAHELGMENLGKVTLGGQDYVMMSTNSEAKTTTEIREIGVGSAVESMYDLQGRKLAAPVKGINIVNGKKVLVK